jgi:hypothetical protein
VQAVEVDEMAVSGRSKRLGALVLVAVLGIGAVVLIKPGSSGTATGTQRPVFGITEAQAIEIATRTSIASGEVSAGASAGYNEKLGRWVWHVSWAYSAGPTSAEYCEILVDYQSGEILDRYCVVA